MMETTVTLPAHFDGTQILLDEPYELRPEMKLMATVLPTSSDVEHSAWAQLSLDSLARAYGADEPEYADSSGLAFSPSSRAAK